MSTRRALAELMKDYAENSASVTEVTEVTDLEPCIHEVAGGCHLCKAVDGGAP